MATKLRFTREMDVLLMRETLAIRAWEHTQGVGWKQIAANLIQTGHFPPTLTPRSVRDRVQLLLDTYVRKREFEESTGIKQEKMMENVEKVEKEQLLQELLLLREVAIKEATEKSAFKRRVDKDVDVPSLSMECVSPADDAQSETSPYPSGSGWTEETAPSEAEYESAPAQRKGKKRQLDRDALLFMQEREEKRLELQKEELEIRREELALQKERDQYDREERRQQMEMQREREAFDRQERQKFMELLTKMINSKHPN